MFFRWESTAYLVKILPFVVKKVEGHLLGGGLLLQTMQYVLDELLHAFFVNMYPYLN